MEIQAVAHFWRTQHQYPEREPSPDDHLFESHGVKVVVDPKSLPFLEGTQLDFTREGLNEGFKFSNPNIKDECGCGESFNV